MNHFMSPAFSPTGYRRTPAAFSLLEIMVSFVIIAVVVVLSVAAIASMRKSAGNTRCIANLRQLGVAIMTYATEHDGLLPPGRDYSNGFSYWFMDREMWAYKYIGVDRAPRCFRCPLDTFVTDAKHYYSYTWNVEFLQDWPQKGNTRNPDGAKIYLRDAQGKILMADGANGEERVASNPNASSNATPLPIQLGVSVGPGKTAVNLSKRHNGGANCLMGDGSVQWYLYEDVWTPELMNHW